MLSHILDFVLCCPMYFQKTCLTVRQVSSSVIINVVIITQPKVHINLSKNVSHAETHFFIYIALQPQALIHIRKEESDVFHQW